MKKVVTLTMIKNESDIVETFVRYTMNFARKMIFIDNGCVDGSLEILKELIKEGFDLEIYTEAHQFYEQYLIENKYIKKIASEYKFDFLIPLDVDEFLEADRDLPGRIDLLPQDRVTMLKWKTYCILSENVDGFFLDKITHVRVNEDKAFTKVIIPYQIIKKKHVLVTMGHHDIESEQPVERYYPHDICMAHFPVRSKEQIYLKIYQGTIAQLMSIYHKVVAFHWKKMQEEIKEKNFDIVKYSMEYALLPEEDLKKISYIEQKFDYSWCSIPIRPIYNDMRDDNILDVLYEMMQVIAIKSIVKEENDRKNILVYGTGGTAKNLFQFIESKGYNVLAYIDSDKMKEYTQFQNKLVLAPDKIKYFNYEGIIIASIYFDEIYNKLLESGVKKNKIVSRFDIIEEQLIDED